MAPVWAWIALFVAVSAMSSGGIWFALLTETPPALKAAWRLTLTSMLQFLPAVYEYSKASSQLLRKWRNSMPLMILTGFLLAVHFISWSWSINHTSLAHSLLFVSATPLLLVCWMAIRYAISKYVIVNKKMGPVRGEEGGREEGREEERTTTTITTTTANNNNYNDSNDDEGETARISTTPTISSSSSSSAPIAVVLQAENGLEAAPSSSSSSSLSHWCTNIFAPENSLPPTRLEAVGAMIGFIGAAVLIIVAGEESGTSTASSSTTTTTTSEDSVVTASGDAMALVGAGAMCFYLAVGGKLRTWMPLWLYAFPVTAAAAISACILSLLFEEKVHFTGTDSTSVFGWASVESGGTSASVSSSSSANRFTITLAAAGFSGILGHTLANAALKHVNALIVSVCVLAEPLVGSFMGWAAGVQGVPSMSTFIAGPLLLLGAVATTIGARDSGWSAEARGSKCGKLLGLDGSNSRNSNHNDGTSSSGSRRSSLRNSTTATLDNHTDAPTTAASATSTYPAVALFTGNKNNFTQIEE